MKVFLVRHGKAEEHTGMRDEDRSLTPKGVQQAQYLGQAVRTIGVKPAMILTSGLTRAFETARIIHSALNCRVLTAPALEPGPGASEVIDLIASHARKGSPLMLVGHNPQLGEVAAILTSGYAGCETMLKTGEAVEIEVDPDDLVGSGRVVARLRLEEACSAGRA
jgi:phosphohistidine phosphatase